MATQRDNMIDGIAYQGKLDRGRAAAVFDYYLDNGIIRMRHGSLEIIHGVYMDPPVIKRAAKLAAAPAV